jgi:colanic acid/amylovoran biosynthesis glycosyltransferase
MNILFVLNSFPALSETFILDQIVGVVEQGHEVEIEATRPVPPPDRVHERVARFALLARTRYREPAPASWLGRLRSGAGLIAAGAWRQPGAVLGSLDVLRRGREAASLRLLHERFPARGGRRRYDVIHCHYGPNGAAAVARRRAGALRGPILTTFHGYDVNLWPRLHGPGLYRQLFADGELFSVGSQFLRQRLAALGAPEDRVALLPMGVDLGRLEAAPRPPPAPGELRLLTVARLTEVKGVEFILRALALARGHPGIRCTVAGDGPLRAPLAALAAELGVASRVDFIGGVSQEEAVGLYARAQAFVLASIVTDSGEEESQPVVLAEAQACGLPVVATAIGGVPESVAPGGSALLVPPRDPGALAAAFIQLCEHPERWAAMGRAGRALVETRFDRAKLRDELAQLYRRLAT